MRSAEVITGTYYPLESTAHISDIAQGEKSHTDYTDFHRNSSPTTNYARKRADYTEPDEKKTKTTAIPICGIARFSEHKSGRKICENQRNLREMIG